MKHEKRMDVLDHAMGARFLNRRYRCEWCDLEVAPEEVLCEAWRRAELDKEMAMAIDPKVLNRSESAGPVAARAGGRAWPVPGDRHKMERGRLRRGIPDNVPIT